MTQCQSPAPDRLLLDTQELRNALVRKSHRFRFQQDVTAESGGAEVTLFDDELTFIHHELTDLLQKPGVNFGEGKQLLIRHPKSHPVGQSPQSVWKRCAH